MESTVLPDFFFPSRDFTASWFGFPPTCENSVFGYILPPPSFWYCPSLTPKVPILQRFHWLPQLFPGTSSLSFRELSALCSESTTPAGLFFCTLGHLKMSWLWSQQSQCSRDICTPVYEGFSIGPDFQLHCHENLLKEEIDLWHQYAWSHLLWQSSLLDNQLHKKHLEWSALFWWWNGFFLLLVLPLFQNITKICVETVHSNLDTTLSSYINAMFSISNLTQ